MQDRLRAVGHRLAGVPAGRRSKWVVLGVWLVIFVVMGPLAGKFEDAQENDPADYLPANAESVKTLDRLDGFPSDGEADAITVFHRDGGLTAEDRAAIARVRVRINARVRTEINAERRDTVAETGPTRVSRDGSTALMTTPITVPEEGERRRGGPAHRHARGDQGRSSGFAAKRARGGGDLSAGFASDAVEVFNDYQRHPADATAGLVLVLLIVIYRSPFFRGSPSSRSCSPR